MLLYEIYRASFGEGIFQDYISDYMEYCTLTKSVIKVMGWLFIPYYVWKK
jgi:hypothetical protein